VSRRTTPAAEPVADDEPPAPPDAAPAPEVAPVPDPNAHRQDRRRIPESADAAPPDDGAIVTPTFNDLVKAIRICERQQRQAVAKLDTADAALIEAKAMLEDYLTTR
jgi:hypothetical protein